MPVSEQLKALVDQMPNPDARGMYCTDVDKEKIEKGDCRDRQGRQGERSGHHRHAGRARQRSGRQATLRIALSGRLYLGEQERKRTPGVCRGTCLATQQRTLEIHPGLLVSRTAMGRPRRKRCPPWPSCLRTRIWSIAAAAALVAIKDGSVEVLRAALPGAQGRCRLVILHSLVALADPQAAAAWKEALKDPDREVRLAAGAGLAKIGDASAVDLLLKAADAEPAGSESRPRTTASC